MYNRYKEWMDQQTLSSQSKEIFYQKLDSTTSKTPTIPFGKILIIAACICLLIPCVAFAAENIFDVAKVNLSEYPDASGKLVPSYEIDFEEGKEFPLEEIAEKWRYIEEGQIVSYETWEEAQQDMGIDLLENTEFNSAKPIQTLPLYLSEGKSNVHCYNLYRSLDEQLYSISNHVAYSLYGINVRMDTEILVEHPTLPQEVKDVFTAVIFLDLEDDSSSFENMKTEQYTSPSGLTATFVYEGSHLMFALFRANGVRYEIKVTDISSEDPYTAKELLIKILDGFVVS